MSYLEWAKIMAVACFTYVKSPFSNRVLHQVGSNSRVKRSKVDNFRQRVEICVVIVIFPSTIRKVHKCPTRRTSPAIGNRAVDIDPTTFTRRRSRRCS